MIVFGFNEVRVARRGESRSLILNRKIAGVAKSKCKLVAQTISRSNFTFPSCRKAYINVHEGTKLIENDGKAYQ